MVTNTNVEPEHSSFRENVFRIEKQIEEATSNLFQLDAVLKNVCETIQTELKFDFATIQLIRPEKHIIEAALGTGAAKEWTGRARHYLEPKRSLRDIQADIALTCRTEVIAGWDKEKRFDKWVYTTFKHDRFSRIFAPILLIQDDQGKNNNNWFNDFTWRYAKNEKGKEINELNNEWFSKPEQRKSEDTGQHIAIDLLLPRFYSVESPFIVEVIGTIEVGYENADEHEPIRVERAVELIRLIGKAALEIRRTQLPCVLETIAKNAMRMVGAEGTSLHFLRDDSQERSIYRLDTEGRIEQSWVKPNGELISYVYEVFSGLVGRKFLAQSRPRKNGLGAKSIELRKPLFIPDHSKGHVKNELVNYNPIAHQAGIRSIVAVPLIFDEEQGVLYIHFGQNTQFEESALNGLQLFANRAKHAIQYAFIYEHQRDRGNQLLILHEVVSSLANIPDEENLLNFIAWNTLNILAADTITIYKYIESENRFPPQPATAGKFNYTDKAQQEIDDNDVPALLVKHGTNVFPENDTYQKIFGGSAFIQREEMKTSAGILLKAGKQVIGTMFINYRYHHRFSLEEKQVIETLASSAAIAIQNQRWLSALHEIDRKIINAANQREVLKLIMRKAIQMTGADIADIRLLDPISEKLLMEVWHPEIDSRAPEIQLQLNQGITGRVAQEHKSILENKVKNNPDYVSCFEPSGSELCVPLLAEHQVLGVLNLESYQTNAFEERHLRMMETLAGQAVIAIQNIENKEQSIATGKIAALGDFTGQLVHTINNDVGAIQVWTQKILAQGDDYSKSIATDIQSKVGELIQRAKRLGNLLEEDPKYLNLHVIIEAALTEVCLSKNINQEIILGDEIPVVLASQQQLVYVFSNLIQNAKDAMPDGGKISIKCKNVELEGQHWILVEVCNTGRRIEVDEREKIFQLGYSTKSGHKGFGLWWSKTYIRRLGGTLKLGESSSEYGTQFIVLLPIVM